MNFQDKLEAAISKNNSLVCVGLDPDPENPKSRNQFLFNKKIIDQTASLVCAYKPNIAFYEASGIEGLHGLKKTIDYLKKNYPEIPVILDAKRGDVENTSRMYAEAAYNFLDADAVTVNPYLGFDSLIPFLERKEKGTIILVITSNPGASTFQDLKVDGGPLYLKIAEEVVKWQKKYPNLLMVVGATWSEEINKIRKIAKNITFLVPGIGAQGGDLKKTLKYGLKKNGRGLIIAASRSIIYASDPKIACQKLRDEINQYR